MIYYSVYASEAFALWLLGSANLDKLHRSLCMSDMMQSCTRRREPHEVCNQFSNRERRATDESGTKIANFKPHTQHRIRCSAIQPSGSRRRIKTVKSCVRVFTSTVRASSRTRYDRKHVIISWCAASTTSSTTALLLCQPGVVAVVLHLDKFRRAGTTFTHTHTHTKVAHRAQSYAQHYCYERCKMKHFMPIAGTRATLNRAFYVKC